MSSVFHVRFGPVFALACAGIALHAAPTEAATEPLDLWEVRIATEIPAPDHYLTIADPLQKPVVQQAAQRPPRLASQLLQVYAISVGVLLIVAGLPAPRGYVSAAADARPRMR